MVKANKKLRIWENEALLWGYSTIFFSLLTYLSLTTDQLNQSVATTEARIDSLRNLTPDYATRYEGCNSTDIAAIVVKCHYRYVMPGTTEAKEHTDSFVLTPDGEKVMGKVIKSGD